MDSRDYVSIIAAVTLPQARDARGKLRTCQERVARFEQYCDAPATVLIECGEDNPLWMCPSCAGRALVERAAHWYVRAS